MTANDIITAVDALRANEYTDSQKLDWLTYLDRAMFADILLAHSHNIPVSEEAPTAPADGDLWMDSSVTPYVLKRYRTADGVFNPVWPYTSGSDELLFTDNAVELYRLYLIVQIDFYNAEYGRYNNDSAMFNAAYSQFERAYSRANKAKSATRWSYI